MQIIPRWAMKQSCIYFKRSSVDEYGNTTYETGIAVNFIRIEPITQAGLKTLGEFKDDKLLLFYDYKNSLPTGIIFKELDKITFNEVEYIVRTVNDYIGHHAEVILK